MASDDTNIPVSELRKRFEQKSRSTAPVRTKPPKQVQPVQKVQPMQRVEPVQKVQPSERTQPLKEVEPPREVQESQKVEPPKKVRPSEVEPKRRLDSKTSDSETDNELRLVLIGITGSGKSSSANTILGEKRFKATPAATFGTAKCKVEHKQMFGRKVVIVDTPGAFDAVHTNGQITIEIIRCIAMSAPGPHAFVMVLKIGRFTPEDRETIEYFEDVFGNKFSDYLFVLFTGIDDLEEHETDLEQFLAEAPEELRKIIDKCGGRYVGFNNREKDEEKKKQMVRQLIDKIKSNVQEHGGKHYTSAVLEAAEKEIRERQEEILKQKEDFETERKKLEEEFRKKLEKIEEEAEKRQKILKEKEEEIEKREEKIFKEKEEVRKREEALLKDKQGEDREGVKLISENEVKQKENVMEKESERRKEEIEKAYNQLEEDLKAKEVESRRQSRSEVRQEVGGDSGIIDKVAVAVENSHWKSVRSLVMGAGGLAVKGFLKVNESQKDVGDNK